MLDVLAENAKEKFEPPVQGVRRWRSMSPRHFPTACSKGSTTNLTANSSFMQAEIKAANVHVSTEWNLGRFELVSWVNSLLTSNFSKVEDFHTGEAYCQMMHCLYPSVVSIGRIKFQAKTLREYEENFKILQKAFEKVLPKKEIRVKELVERKFSIQWHFAKWFHAFFEKNKFDKDIRSYDAFERRGRLKMGSDSQSLMERSPKQRKLASLPGKSTLVPSPVAKPSSQKSVANVAQPHTVVEGVRVETEINKVLELKNQIQKLLKDIKDWCDKRNIEDPVSIIEQIAQLTSATEFKRERDCSGDKC